MKNMVSLFYHYQVPQSSRFILFQCHPSLPLEKVQTELTNIKYFFGEETKVIISTEGYVDELIQQCDSMPYDAYVLSSDDRDVIDQAAENILAGNFYLSKNVMKAYFKSRRLEYDHQ